MNNNTMTEDHEKGLEKFIPDEVYRRNGEMYGRNDVYFGEKQEEKDDGEKDGEEKVDLKMIVCKDVKEKQFPKGPRAIQIFDDFSSLKSTTELTDYMFKDDRLLSLAEKLRKKFGIPSLELRVIGYKDQMEGTLAGVGVAQKKSRKKQKVNLDYVSKFYYDLPFDGEENNPSIFYMHFARGNLSSDIINQFLKTVKPVDLKERIQLVSSRNPYSSTFITSDGMKYVVETIELVSLPFLANPESDLWEKVKLKKNIFEFTDPEDLISQVYRKLG